MLIHLESDGRSFVSLTTNFEEESSKEMAGRRSLSVLRPPHWQEVWWPR